MIGAAGSGKTESVLAQLLTQCTRNGLSGVLHDYKDFELSLEFLQEADGNSGVFVRSTIDGTKVSGWQVEVAPKGKHTGGVYESYGRGWLVKPEVENRP